ncbi:MAG: DUF4040 domain-containing protein [Candidatus Sabulitectum sp.]|nr:DUF4040 domain-containing protein [Candidatus Sabulitectum sp.]
MTLLAAASIGTGVMMLVAAVAALVVKKLISAIIIVGFVSLSASVLFLLMNAPDVAITEASIGAAISTVIFLWGRGKIGGEE